MSNWKFFIANSSNMVVQADITSYSRDKQLSLSFNRSGNLGLNLPLNLEYLELTQTNQYCLIAMKNDVVVWSGPIWTRSIDFNEEKITLSAVGWFEILMYRFLTTVVPDAYEDENEGDIVLSTAAPVGLLKIANDNHPTWLVAGTNSATSLRTVSYEIFQSIGENIISLSDMEDGFDIYVDPVTRELNITDATEFADKTDIPFGYHWGVENIENIVIDENGGEMRNEIHVVGSSNNVYTASDAASIATNNMLEEVVQLTEENDATLLQAIANSEVALKGKPQINYEITLKPQGPSNPYEIFEDYTLGDRIQFVANKRVGNDLIQITHTPRVFAATIDINEFGQERVSSLQTTFSE